MQEEAQLEAEYRRLVLQNLEELQRDMVAAQGSLVKVRIDVAVLKSRNAIIAAGFGIVGGLLASIAASLILRALNQ